MLKKILASLFVGFALIVAQPVWTGTICDYSIAEAGTTYDRERNWEVVIDDSSIYMVEQNHAHVAFKFRNLVTGSGWSPVEVADVMWGKGYVCNYLYSGKPVSPSDIGLAIANYMSARY